MLKWQDQKTQELNWQKTFLNIAFILIPGFLWWAAVSARPSVISTNCASHLAVCLKENLPILDQFSLGIENGVADQFSYWTQNLSGILGFLIPLLLGLVLYFTRKLSPIAALILALTDLGIILQTMAWNGFFTELSHFIGQRPRPFVFIDPMTRGINPSHFTSFYSGHTSFTAATNIALLLMLIHRKIPLVVCAVYALLAEALILSTAYFRIMAGRHFLTDVICGALAGTAISFIIGYIQRYPKKSLAVYPPQPSLLE